MPGYREDILFSRTNTGLPDPFGPGSSHAAAGGLKKGPRMEQAV